MHCSVCGSYSYYGEDAHEHCALEGCRERIEITCVDADWDSERGYHSPDLRALPGEYKECASCSEWFCVTHMTSMVCTDCAADPKVCIDCGDYTATLGRCIKCAAAFPVEKLRGAA